MSPFTAIAPAALEDKIEINVTPPQKDRAQGTPAWRRGRSAPYPTRGYRGSSNLSVHRNRSLVLNNNGNGTKQQGNGDSDIDASSLPDASTPSWVTKNDRHRQLINTSIYEKDAQARTKAIEQTRQQRLAKKDDLERTKLLTHIQRTAGSGGVAGGGAVVNANPQAPGKYEISVQGIQFLVVKNGSKLVKAPGKWLAIWPLH